MSDVVNKSGLLPVGRAVLVKPYQPERKVGMIVLTETIERNQQMIDQRAVVIAVGPHAWDGEPTARAVPGDKVLVSAFSGYLAKGTADNEQYRFVNDKDIFAKIEVESHE